MKQQSLVTLFDDMGVVLRVCIHEARLSMRNMLRQHGLRAEVLYSPDAALHCGYDVLYEHGGSVYRLVMRPEKGEVYGEPLDGVSSIDDVVQSRGQRIL